MDWRYLPGPGRDMRLPGGGIRYEFPGVEITWRRPIPPPRPFTPSPDFWKPSPPSSQSIEVARRIAERRAQDQARLLAEQAAARERIAREARERVAREREHLDREARERVARHAREQAELLVRERAVQERAQREAQERLRQQQAAQQELAQQIRQRRPPPWLEEELQFSRLAEKTGDAKVQQFIDEALKNAGGKTEAERLENAWVFLKNRRDTYNERSDELTAAEQYLFARSKVAGHHAYFPYLRFAVPGYQAYKWLFYSLELEDYLWKGSDEGHVPSMPSDMQHRWGLKGALDGMGNQRTKLQRIIDEQFRKAGGRPPER